MPASLLEPVFEILCFGTGAAIIRFCSFGKIVLSLETDTKLPWYGWRQSETGKLLIAPDWATFAGLVFWILILIILMTVFIF